MKRNSAAMKVSQDQEVTKPFASYAQLVRMLMPLARKVAFHDERGRVLWVSDGIEEAELSMQAQLLIARYMNDDPRERDLNAHSSLPEPVHVFPIRDGRNELLGALAIQFDHLPPQAGYRSYATVQRMLAPLLDILLYSWRFDAQAKSMDWKKQSADVGASLAAIKPAPPVAVAPATAVTPTPASVAVLKSVNPPTSAPEIPRATPTALPAVMRSLLVDATEATAASFGTIALPGHAFSFNHRRDADESDFNVSAVADAARAQMLQWMATHNEPVINNERNAQTPFANYKLLAYPIRVDAGPLLALIVLFRRRQEPNFTADDLTLLAEVTAQIPRAVLAELQRLHTTRALALTYPPQAKVAAAPVATSASTSSPVLTAEPKPTVATSTPQADATALLSPDITPEAVADEGEGDDEDEIDPVPSVAGAPLPTITERVRAALNNDAFELHAQRIAPLHDYSRPERFEVLLRMPDKYGLQTPASFMSAAQAGELLPALDLWVIRHTLSLLRLNNRLGRDSCELSVNLSAASLADATFLDKMLTEIRGSRVKPGQLGFEVAESVAIRHMQAFRHFTEQLQATGCRVTLDNCRSGVALFDLLLQPTVNCIKIDGSIVRESGINPATQSLLQSIVQRATERGIESVAEHVESQLICSTIINSGFDYAQGFHLEAPAPLAKLFY